MRTDTLPRAAAAPPGGRSGSGPRVRAATAIAIALVAAALAPASSHGVARGVLGAAAIGFARWSSIVLAALPYVTIGAVAGAGLERLPRRIRACAAFAVLAAPGCDCSASGYARALARGSLPLAGFALVWNAAAGPAALFSTRAVLGSHILVARVAGGLVASALTAASWCAGGGAHVRRSLEHGSADDEHARPAWTSICTHAASTLGALAVTALVATLALGSIGDAIAALSSPVLAAAAGALLSPCSTSDAVLARVLVRDAPAQAAFVIASQTIDLRQLATIARVFGPRRAVLAAIAGLAGCATAAVLAR